MTDGNAVIPAGGETPEPPAGVLHLAAYWGVVGAWMVIISLMSSEPFSASNTNRYLDPVLRYLFPHLGPAGFTFAHSVIRKVAHFSEFFVLGCLIYWASRRGRAPRWKAVWMFQALGLAVIYGLVDEAHQAFVPHRTSSMLDSSIDTLGAAASQATIYLRHLATRVAPSITQDADRTQRKGWMDMPGCLCSVVGVGAGSMAAGKRQRRQAARMGVLLRVERQLWSSGLTRVAGVDEVGVGPLAGPVVAAAVIVPAGLNLRGVDDSKKLSAALREELAAKIRAGALAVGIGIVEVGDIDRLNIYHAALEAMRRAVIALPLAPEHVVVDARRIPGLMTPQTPLIDGDARCYSVAAASIVAKVTRDRIMAELDIHYPQYGFGVHMGYATAQHLAAIDRYGPCPVHRRSFAPVRELRLPGM